MKIYHYTSIETLALILKNKTIRFNRLDQVDDVEEVSECSLRIKLGLYTFVSCWTKSHEENVALWKMYTPNMRGVRIELDSNMFLKQEINTEIKKDSLLSATSSIIPDEKIHYKGYVVNIWGDPTNWLYPIEYVRNPVEMAKEAIVITPENSSLFHFDKIGTYKHTRWNFQEESRYKLFVLPDFLPNESLDEYWQRFRNIITNNTPPPFTDYYVDIAPKYFSEMEITLGPLSNISDQIIVESLVKEHCPSVIIKASNLIGKIRK